MISVAERHDAVACKVRAAILRGMKVYDVPAWRSWAERWLSGEDQSERSAAEAQKVSVNERKQKKCPHRRLSPEWAEWFDRHLVAHHAAVAAWHFASISLQDYEKRYYAPTATIGEVMRVLAAELGNAAEWAACWAENALRLAAKLKEV